MTFKFNDLLGLLAKGAKGPLRPLQKAESPTHQSIQQNRLNTLITL